MHLEKAVKAAVTLPLNPKYRPSTDKWVCTCPQFATSRFLLCKHLVQSVPDMPPIFFLEVKRYHTAPFWRHTLLNPDEDMDIETNVPTDPCGNESDGEDDDEEDLIDMEVRFLNASRATSREDFTELISTIQAFADGLEYQIQFEDRRMLEIVEQEGAGFLRLAENCLSREWRANTRGQSPTMWERATSNAMFYRTRPPISDH